MGESPHRCQPSWCIIDKGDPGTQSRTVLDLHHPIRVTNKSTGELDGLVSQNELLVPVIKFGVIIREDQDGTGKSSRVNYGYCLS